MKSSLLLVVATLGIARAFTAAPHHDRRYSSASTRHMEVSAHNIEKSRRTFVSAAVTAGASLLFTRPALADVSDGNALPQGAAQFSRLLKTKSDLGVISKRVAENASEIDKKEWDNIGQFLRRLYSVGDDMKVIAGGIYDPQKKTKAAEDIKLLQKYAKAAEGPINKQDGPAFVSIMNKCIDLIDDFLELLRDVPDEL